VAEIARQVDQAGTGPAADIPLVRVLPMPPRLSAPGTWVSRIVPLSTKLTQETPVIGSPPLLDEPTLIVKPEDRSQTTRWPLVRGGVPAGECAKSRTNLPSIHVWQAM
jgi:hypothetical protein